MATVTKRQRVLLIVNELAKHGEASGDRSTSLSRRAVSPWGGHS